MAFLRAPGIPWLYSGVTNTNASNGSIFAAQALVWGFEYWPRDGGTGSSKSGRLKSRMSTSSNSASPRFFAISNTHRATASALRPGRVLPMMIATLTMIVLLVLRVSAVGITVEPPLAGLGRRDDGMDARARVLARMLVGRGVAAERRSTRLAGTQVHPDRSDSDALVAFPLSRTLDLLDLIQMVTGRDLHGSTSAPTRHVPIQQGSHRHRRSYSGTS